MLQAFPTFIAAEMAKWLAAGPGIWWSGVRSPIRATSEFATVEDILERSVVCGIMST